MCVCACVQVYLHIVCVCVCASVQVYMHIVCVCVCVCVVAQLTDTLKSRQVQTYAHTIQSRMCTMRFRRCVITLPLIYDLHR